MTCDPKTEHVFAIQSINIANADRTQQRCNLKKSKSFTDQFAQLKLKKQHRTSCCSMRGDKLKSGQRPLQLHLSELFGKKVKMAYNSKQGQSHERKDWSFVGAS